MRHAAMLIQAKAVLKPLWWQVPGCSQPCVNTLWMVQRQLAWQGVAENAFARPVAVSTCLVALLACPSCPSLNVQCVYSQQ